MGSDAPGAAIAQAPDAESEWPDENDESEFLSQAGVQGQQATPQTGRASALVVGEKLPPMEELVARVPENLRVILDDLFRAKFTGVRKFSPAVRPGDTQ
jgi:hypothetical protein